MKKLSYIAVVGMMSLGLASCSLDSENMTDSTTENFPKTEKDATASLAAIYENLNAVNATPRLRSITSPCWLPTITSAVVVPTIR